ncbi:MAG: hypothetical protein HY698_13390 [Deltaproteobacteria bacterium]|nr:hypothetical protein [Deltaproteobacteria bacterium]
MLRDRHRFIAAIMAPIFLGFTIVTTAPAYAWKPHTHSLTANLALKDAADGKMCLPGLSTNQIPRGQTDLNGTFYDPARGWTRFDDLVSLDRYVRAGALGPDAFPDPIFGQLAIHVDWSRKVSEEQPIRLPPAAEAILPPQLIPNILAPILNHTPSWRSIDWGHEVLKEALRLNNDIIDGATRSGALAQDGLLKSAYLERQAAVAFALGYLMHMSGDSFAHGWINNWTGQPFSYFTGRQGQVAHVSPEVAPAVEELQHMAIEKYVQSRFVPELAEECTPVDPAYYQGTTSICQGEDGEPFPIDCQYCNPLRGVPSPIDAPLSTTCDHCFTGCNPWREICPPKVNEGLPCSQCRDRGKFYQACISRGGTDAACQRETELRCSDASYQQCCDQMVDILKRSGVISATDDKYTCKAGEMPPSEVYADVKQKHEELMAQMPANIRGQIGQFSPNGCYTGQLSEYMTEAKTVTVNGQSVTLGPGNEGAETDFNGDGKPDLVNECMLWNCLLSPGTSNCPLNALIASLPPTLQAGSLECTSYDTAQLVNNPDPLLNATGIAVPTHLYKRVFLERRFPADKEPGSLGTYSIGGYIPNGVYTVTDALRVFADALDALQNPLVMIADKCLNGGTTDECALAKKIAAIKAAVAIAAAILTAMAIAVYPIPFGIGPVLAAVFFALAFYVGSALVIMDSGIIPGLTLPLHAMRAKLLLLLEDKWLGTIMKTAEAMSGQGCTSTCGGNIPTCDEHRFLGINAYFDWAIEAYDIVSDLRCEENSYFNTMVDTITASGSPRFRDVLNMVASGFVALLTQYLSCKVANHFYNKAMKGALMQIMQENVLNPAARAVCSIVNYHIQDVSAQRGVEIVTNGPEWEKACREGMRAYYGNVNDPIAVIRALREILAALDNGGLTDAQKLALFPSMEELLRAQGINVDLFALDRTSQAIDCSFPVAANFKLSAREQVVESFRLVLGDGAAATVDAMARQLGEIEDYIEIRKFAPLYNTIQLNKLIVMGTGEPGCGRAGRRCSEGDQEACFEYRLCTKYPQPSQAGAGLLGLVKAANLQSPSLAFQGAYSIDALDDGDSTFLTSLFQESPIERGSSAFCSEIDFNIMCNSVYSIDDPDDYCRDLALWSPAKFDDLVRSEHAPGGVINECAEALEGIDDYAAVAGLVPYEPTDRREIGPDNDPHWLYTAPLSDDDHRNAYSHRSTVMTRVVAQGLGGNFPTPMSPSSTRYYPHDLRRFALANKDSQVSRLYARIFAPFYCPGGGTGQQDRDCDSIADSCDNCPDTYNPDQYDDNWDGIGDDCVGYNPITGVTPPNKVWNACGQAATALGGASGTNNVSAGTYHSCVADWQGAAKCWGYNNYGQSRPPTGKFLQISAGLYHTCGIRSNGALACFGANTSNRATPPTGQFSQVSVGTAHACALNASGTARCWGLSDNGRTTVPSNTTFRQVTAGGAHSCGIRTDGTVRCWGSNSSGQATPPTGKFVHVDAGTSHTCGVRSDGKILCWGSNLNNRSTPPDGRYRRVTAGEAHSCGIRTDGTAVCWGSNTYGQVASQTGAFADISAGGTHTCGMRPDGTLKCWGRNNYGQSSAPFLIQPVNPLRTVSIR